MGLLIMMGIFAFGVVIGIPVAFALGIGAVSAFYFEGLPLIIAFQRIISGINVFSLLAIPFFILQISFNCNSLFEFVLNNE